jgi:streptogramin lyase
VPFGFTSVVTSIATGTNGDLWFMATSDGHDSTESVGHVSASGLITGFASQQLEEGNIVVGPDGNLWITQATVFIPARVERSTQSGSLSTFSTQLNINYLKDFPLGTVGITIGPDGNLWITEAPSAQPGSSSRSTFDVVQFVIARSTPDGTGKRPSARHPKAKPVPHHKPTPKPKHPKHTPRHTLGPKHH